MKKEFVPYEPALELKELGFDEPCFGYYEPNKEFNYINWEVFKDFPYLAKNSEWQDLYGAPTFSQAFKWFRKEYKLVGLIEIGTQEYSFIIFDEVTDSRKITSSMNGEYEEAELACLKKLIEIVKK